jgi:hypothetical protein
VSRRIDVLTEIDLISAYFANRNEGDCVERVKPLRATVGEVLAAAHASLAARDLADQMAADDRLRAALAACEPETPHEPV